MNTKPKEHTARKHHTCSWCGETITPGEHYIRFRGYWEDPVTVKFHMECHHAWENPRGRDIDMWDFYEFCRGCYCSREGDSCNGNCDYRLAWVNDR